MELDLSLLRKSYTNLRPVSQQYRLEAAEIESERNNLQGKFKNMAMGRESFNKSGEMVGSVLLLLLLSSMLFHQVSAGCDNIDATLASCQAAVEGDNPPPPTPECCNTLRTLNVGCLCKALLKNGLKNINKQAAFLLPTKCAVSIPPGFNCAAHEEYPIPGDI